MAELAVVRRYARALFDTANRAGQVQQAEDDLKVVDEVLRTVPRFVRALRAPTISSARKKELLSRAFAGRVGPLTERFLNLVIDRRREAVLPLMYEEFRRMANQVRNIVPVEVTAAAPLTDDERVRLTAALEQRTGKQITLNVSIDPALMGGMRLRMGDTVIDGSIRARLAQLHERLLQGTF